MQKTATLYPSCITDGSAFSGILSSNGTGSDYRTLKSGDGHAKGDGLSIGIIGFNMAPLQKLSGACILNTYAASYQQRVYPENGSYAGFNFILSPLCITKYSINGSSLTVKSSTAYGSGFSSETTGDKFLSKGGTFYNSADASIIGRMDKVLAFKLNAKLRFSPAVQQAHMRNLKATITYTARYFATFLNENGSLLDLQTIDGGQRATAPAAPKTGYQLVGWLCANDNKTYTVLPTSEDTDLLFRPVYEPVYYRVIVPYDEKASSRICVYDSATQTFKVLNKYVLNSSQSYCDIPYGSQIQVDAVNFNKKSEDLLVTINGIEKIVAAGTRFDVPIFKTEALLEDITITVQAVPVYFSISTTADANGTITPTQQTLRYENADVVITPSTGYEIETIAVDGQDYPISNKNETTIAFQSVTSDHQVSVKFSKIQIPITLKHSNNTSIDGPAFVAYGDSAVWTITAKSGFSISAIAVNDNRLVDTFEALTTYRISLNAIQSAVTIDVEDSADLVTVTVQPCENGKITGPSGTFIKGKGALQFEAIPNNGYAFFEWTGAPWKTASYCLDTAVSADTYKLGATFELLDYSIYTEVAGNGSIITSAEYANYGDVVTFKAVPDEGWRFLRWHAQERRPGVVDVLGVPDEPLFSHVICGDLSVRAVFIPEEYTLGVFAQSPDGNAIGGTATTKPSQETYHFQDTIELVAIPDAGYRFVKWSDGVYSARRVFSMPAGNVKLAAEFCRYEYMIQAEAIDHATVTLTTNGITTQNAVTVKYGDDVTIQIVCDYGYRIEDLLIDDVSVQSTRTIRGAHYVLTAVNGAHSVKVVLTKKTYANGRKLFDYWPPVIARIMEMQEIARVQQPLIDEAWDAASSVLENQFIDSATDEAVQQWESELGLVPLASDTLEQRKKRLKLKWVPDNRFTMPWLYNWLKQVCETDEIKIPMVKNYVLTVALPAAADFMSIFSDLEKYKPANIALNSTVNLTAGVQSLTAGVGLRVSMKVQIESGDST